MFVGLDVSKKETVGVWKDEKGSKISEEIFPTNQDGLQRLAAKLDNCEVVLEASTSGVFVYDFLREKGLSVKVANPNAIKSISHSEKKTDREDAEKLADLLRTGMLPTCYLPDKRTRELKDIIRHRRALVVMNTSLKNKVRSILTREGISLPYTDVLGDKSIKWLNDVELGRVQRAAISRFVILALYVRQEISDYNTEIYKEHLSNKDAQLLATIPGIGYYGAVHILSAIGDIKRFPSDEELASYAGIVPKIRQSGELRYSQGLKHGDRQLRWIMVQCASAAIRSSKRLRKYYLKKKRKKNHQKAIVAVARKMIEIMYCMLTRGETYQE